MEAIVLTDEELKHLERRFGPGVRLMGSWCSDGTFGYSSVPMLAVEKAAEILESPYLHASVSRLKETVDLGDAFIELLQNFGSVLIEGIVDAYRQCSLERMPGACVNPEPSQGKTRTASEAV